MSEANLPHFKKWLEDNFQEKIFVTGGPMEKALDSVFERIECLRKYHDNLVSIYQDMNDRLTLIEDVLSSKEEAVKVRGVDVPISDLVKKPVKK